MTKTNSLPKYLIISAVILRVLLMVFFYHPDIRSQHFHAQFLSQGVINIYEYLKANKTLLPYTDTFNYPPLTYFFLGSWQAITKLLTGPQLTAWLVDWGGGAVNHPGIFLFLFSLKIPYLIVDSLFLFLLLKFCTTANQRHRATFLWAFNPISLYAIYMIGQFDIIPATLTLGAILLSVRRQNILACFLIGIAAAFKTYPLLLLPFIILYIDLWPHRVIGVASGLFGWLLPMLPFLGSPAFSESVFHSSLGGQLLAGNKLFIYPTAYLLFLVWTWTRKEKTAASLLKSFLVVTLSMLVFTNFHPQWIIWSLPFLLYFLATVPKSWIPVLFLVISYFGVVLLIPDQFTLVGLFTPLNPLLSSIPPLTDYLFHLPSQLAIVSRLFSYLFLFSCVYLTWFISQ